MDLRIAPVALGCWAGALAVLFLDRRPSLVGFGLALLAAAITLRLRPGWRWIVLAALLGVACGAAATLARLSTHDSPMLVALTESRGTATVELTVRDDPRPAATRPKLWVVRATLTRITPSPPSPAAITPAASPLAVPSPLGVSVLLAAVSPAAPLPLGVSVLPAAGSPGVLAPRAAESWSAVGSPLVAAIPPPDLVLSVRVVVLAEHEGWRGLLPGQAVRATVRFGRSDRGGVTAALLSTQSGPERLGGPPWAQTAAGVLREGLQRACAPLDPRPGGLLPGLVVGDTSRLDPVLREQFYSTGLTHLTAVSGSNLAIVAGCFLLIGPWLRLRPQWTALLAGLAIAGYVILARPSPSVLRAAVMGGIGLLALASGRHRAALPALCATITVLIVVDPELAADAGFALSVLATGGLLLIAPRMRDALRRKHVPPGVAEAIAIPASAQLACAPVVAGLSGTISLVAIPANLLAVPAVAPATIAGVIAAAISPIWPAGAEFVAWLASWPVRWLVTVAEIGSTIPAGTVPWPGGLLGALALAGLTIAVLIGFRNPAVRRAGLVIGAAIIVGAVPVRLVAAGWPPPGWIAVVCDVGQGDAIVLRAGPATAVVVDAGPDPAGVRQCLSDLGIRHVPVFVLSHLHADHTGGMQAVLALRPGQIVTPDHPEPRGTREALQAEAAGRGIPVHNATPGAQWTIGEVSLHALHTAPLHGTRSDPNNNSLLILAEIRGVRLLLLGDAETEQQQALLHAYPGIAADVVKVAHHGSAYQDLALADRLAARVALISVGAGNDYGHPNPAYLARLRRQGTQVLRTDVDGDLAVIVDGGALRVGFH